MDVFLVVYTHNLPLTTQGSTARSVDGQGAVLLACDLLAAVFSAATPTIPTAHLMARRPRSDFVCR